MSSHKHNEDRTEQVVSTLLSAAGKAPVPPDEAFLDRLSGETMNAFIAASAQRPKRFRGYRIMQTRTLKWLIPAAVAAAIILGVSLWPGKGGRGLGNGVAWADVVNSFQQAGTVQLTVLKLSADGKILERGTMFFKEPDFFRTEAYGKVYIGNMRAGGKVLVLIPETKQAILQSIPGDQGNQENMYEEILKFMSEGAEPIGLEMLDGKQAAVFRNQSRGNAKVWADPQTHLPIRIEMGYDTTPQGDPDRRPVAAKRGMDVITDFVFNAALDDSLFDLTPPAGYRLAPVSAEPLLARTTTMYALRKFAVPLLRYAAEHKEQFPKDLSELEPYGIAAQDLVNPARPEQSPGYVYIRPTSMKDPQLIVMYEGYDKWDRGVNVLYLDGHVEHVNDEPRFLKQLEFTKKQNAETPAK